MVISRDEALRLLHQMPIMAEDCACAGPEMVSEDCLDLAKVVQALGPEKTEALLWRLMRMHRRVRDWNDIYRTQHYLTDGRRFSSVNS